jgi:hypothetical protein
MDNARVMRLAREPHGDRAIAAELANRFDQERSCRLVAVGTDPTGWGR